MDIFKQAEADAAELGITPREALTLHFIAQAALAHMARKPSAEAVMNLAAAHAAGKLDIHTMRRAMDVAMGVAR